MRKWGQSTLPMTNISDSLTLEFFVTSLVVVLVPGTGVIYTLSNGVFRGARASRRNPTVGNHAFLMVLGAVGNRSLTVAALIGSTGFGGA